MTDSLLHSLRHHVLDESQPIAGLLRKCLMLGAETGSDALRGWARRELDGYDDADEIPAYRKIGVPIKMSSQSGSTVMQGQIIDRLQMPQKCWEWVPEKLELTQPVAELEELAQRETLAFANSGLHHAQDLWNAELGPYQSIINLSYTTTGSALAGVLSQIRTHLVDVVADLTADTPLAELPGKEEVDAAVSNRIGQARDVYQTTVHQASGPVAVGTEASATAEGMTVADVVRLLDKVQEMAGEVEASQQTALIDAVAELREAVAKGTPDTGDVVKKAGKLRQIAEKAGTSSVSAAVATATQVVISMAMSGAFG
ncbi:hypothetical protein [Isoptericola sp. b408]|uniref:AbiTii domain-containing protein n=1 Tax=Isoptericola sp. b408 TaxID=3064653 RepID=UPI002713C2CE|nr:hypothetical protein [Isoptericola sp. b408]MDO8151709.1 hypothetical protein [Isoptericola sp. b408]